jgi:hypothetical protein
MNFVVKPAMLLAVFVFGTMVIVAIIDTFTGYEGLVWLVGRLVSLIVFSCVVLMSWSYMFKDWKLREFRLRQGPESRIDD